MRALIGRLAASLLIFFFCNFCFVYGGWKGGGVNEVN